MYIYSHSSSYEFITFSSPATLLEHDVVVVIFRMLASTCVRAYMHVYACTQKSFVPIQKHANTAILPQCLTPWV